MWVDRIRGYFQHGVSGGVRHGVTRSFFGGRLGVFFLGVCGFLGIGSCLIYWKDGVGVGVAGRGEVIWGIYCFMVYMGLWLGFGERAR